MSALKMAARSILPRCTALKLRILNDSMGIRLKNAMDLGKNCSPPSLAQPSPLQSQKRCLNKSKETELHGVQPMIGKNKKLN